MKINVIPRGVMASILMLAVISLIYYSTAALAERGGNGNGKNKEKGSVIIQAVDEVDCTDSTSVLTADTTMIAVGSDSTQCFNFKIEITNADKGDVFVDSIGAVWDIDTAGFAVVDVTPDDDEVDIDNCSVTLTQPASILNPEDKRPDQQPEHITIVMNEDDAYCVVDIYVITVIKKNSFPVTYHPGGCDYLSEDSNMDGVTNPGTNPGFIEDFDDFPLLDGSGVPMVDWVALNDGAKGYDASNAGILMSARLESYQLQPMGCDFDGDGLFDGEEVNTYGTDPLIADTDGDGVWDGIEVDNDTNPNDNSDF